jgi:hypothetical protein
MIINNKKLMYSLGEKRIGEVIYLFILASGQEYRLFVVCTFLVVSLSSWKAMFHFFDDLFFIQVGRTLACLLAFNVVLLIEKSALRVLFLKFHDTGLIKRVQEFSEIVKLLLSRLDDKEKYDDLIHKPPAGLANTLFKAIQAGHVLNAGNATGIDEDQFTTFYSKLNIGRKWFRPKENFAKKLFNLLDESSTGSITKQVHRVTHSRIWKM